MNCYKFNFLFLFILPCFLFGQDNVFSEFKVELIIFKYTDFETNESFKSTLEIPYEDIIYLSDQNSLKNEFEYSNFSNMSSYYKNLFNNNKLSLSELPEPIFRDSTDLNILEKLKNMINQNSEYQLIDTKSWIQTIPSLESSKFLQYEDKNNYGFFLKFYKKRFMHIILKSYLGTLDNSNNLKIFIDVEKRIFDNEIHFFDHPHFGVIVSISGV
mgnify:FL=1